MSSSKMSIKSFLSEVEKILRSCEKSQLEKILFQRAKNIPLGKREDFLNELIPVSQKNITEIVGTVGLLADIECFRNGYKLAMDKYSNGENYYSDEYEYDEDGMRVDPYEDYFHSLRDLFDRAAGTFEGGDFSISAKAYSKLFEIFLMEDTYGSGIRADDLDNFDVVLEISRHARSVYEITKPKDRVDILFNLLWKHRHGYGVYTKTIMLSNVVSVLPAPLPQMDDFLNNWILLLKEKDGEIADEWYREAVNLQGGERALAELARNDGKVRPLVFLDWVSCFLEGRDDEKIIDATQEALNVLPVSIVERAVIADHLFRAAKRQNRKDLMDIALEAALSSSPIIQRLSDIYLKSGVEGGNWSNEKSVALKKNECILQERFNKKGLNSYRSKFYEKLPKTVDRKLMVQSHLLAGNWKAAKEVAETEKDVLGWTHLENCQAIVIPAFFELISIGEKANNIEQLWEYAISQNFEYGTFDDDFEESDSEDIKKARKTNQEILVNAYAEIFSRLKLEKSDLNWLLQWSQKIVEERIDKILLNKYRGAYCRAALLLLACGEAIGFLRGVSEGTCFVVGMKKKYSRFAGFQKELKVFGDVKKWNDGLSKP